MLHVTIAEGARPAAGGNVICARESAGTAGEKIGCCRSDAPLFKETEDNHSHAIVLEVTVPKISEEIAEVVQFAPLGAHSSSNFGTGGGHPFCLQGKRELRSDSPTADAEGIHLVFSFASSRKAKVM